MKDSLATDDASEIKVSMFDYSIENHFRFIDSINKLCGRGQNSSFIDTKIQRLASTITYLSTPCHTWDAFQLAHASFSLYCIRNNVVVPRNSQMAGCNLGGGASLLGEAPIVEVALTEANDGDEEDGSGSNLSTVKIHDDEVSVRFLVCGVACSLDAYLLGCLEDGLNPLLGIEMRGSKFQNRFSVRRIFAVDNVMIWFAR
ncbi:AT-rich interactive domain-containing protein 4-like isoform X2 [Chenopodium quinoa]|uniref:AT-rich interactive domain-containing protein 4-like isoform X2 n=1 Tax=Chenopodium quinoa TaxID=63459 RepID=UPI000B791C66|nr:AT-rich interactive domain-containing protein 4-like isoform X2 [Chenopodium quinoa]